jgi:hypothetical protein
MQSEQSARLTELCEQVAKEQEPKKLLHLVEEINRLLDGKPAVPDQKLPAESHRRAG